ncbi:GbsR/MarR family transcriptional regulator [Demequina aurantiaca]|uniref:GbsR/MarR family transcriptional regulator n=1 Tax=Demequina aurantiaca TaxID=676200 RepID=UPI000784E1F6|nr:MarR family transcriptional regulator [Demequina aurantiaca]
MTNWEADDATATYVADVAEYWERGGFSHAAGQILGHLMVCEPAEQTQAELAEALGLSAGTVSTQLKILLAVEMVERVRSRGVRTSFYQVPKNMWTRVLASETSRIGGLRGLADQGLKVLPQTRPDRIVSLDQMVRFFEHEWPQLEERLEEFLRKEES